MGFAIYLLFDPVSVFQHRSGIFSFKVIIMQNDSGFIFLSVSAESTQQTLKL